MNIKKKVDQNKYKHLLDGQVKEKALISGQKYSMDSHEKKLNYSDLQAWKEGRPDVYSSVLPENRVDRNVVKGLANVYGAQSMQNALNNNSYSVDNMPRMHTDQSGKYAHNFDSKSHANIFNTPQPLTNKSEPFYSLLKGQNNLANQERFARSEQNSQLLEYANNDAQSIFSSRNLKNNSFQSRQGDLHKSNIIDFKPRVNIRNPDQLNENLVRNNPDLINFFA